MPESKVEGGGLDIRFILLPEGNALAFTSPRHSFLRGMSDGYTLFDNQMGSEQKKIYREKQKEIILSVFRQYNLDAPIVMNVSFGHTDPQLVLPYGGLAKIAPMIRELLVKL